MVAALAVRGEDDRPIGRRLADEFLIGGAHVAIGEIQRTPGIGLIGQEGAEGRLAIFGRPDRADAVEDARIAANEQAGAILRFAIVDRRVPGRSLHERGRVDEEDRDARRAGRVEAMRSPQRRVVRDVRPRDPQRFVAIIRARRHRDLVEVAARHEREPHQVLLEQAIENRARHEQDGEPRHDPQEAHRRV